MIRGYTVLLYCHRLHIHKDASSFFKNILRWIAAVMISEKFQGWAKWKRSVVLLEGMINRFHFAHRLTPEIWDLVRPMKWLKNDKKRWEAYEAFRLLQKSSGNHHRFLSLFNHFLLVEHYRILSVSVISSLSLFSEEYYWNSCWEATVGVALKRSTKAKKRRCAVSVRVG